jgi:predicted NBD/HSP70 family sugar kinase
MRIGVDIGGTKTEIVALDDQGRERLRRRTSTPHGDYGDALRDLSSFILATRRELGEPGERASVGIGMPGVVTPQEGLVRNAYATPYNGRPLKHDLEQLLGCELRFANDANCFALSEALDGAGRGHALVFGVILGTGAGGGFVLDRRIMGGANGFAGEWGHNPLPWMSAEEFPGPRCSCGRIGCIEQFVSGPALAAHHTRYSGEALKPVEIVARAGSGDTASLATLARYERCLARALAHVINLIDPDAIVLGGGLSNIERLYVEVPRLWGEYAYLQPQATRLLKAVHGDSSGVRGAAALWDRETPSPR